MKKQANDQAWLHRQNIARYRALLANPDRYGDHDQLRKLLAEEEIKLRALAES